MIKEIKDLIEDLEVEDSVKKKGSYRGKYKGQFVCMDGMKIKKQK